MPEIAQVLWDGALPFPGELAFGEAIVTRLRLSGGVLVCGMLCCSTSAAFPRLAGPRDRFVS